MMFDQISFIGQTGFDDYLCIVPATPEEIEEQFGVKFLDDCDDLDELKIAIVELPTTSGVRKLIFERHKGYPDPHTTVRVQRLTDAQRAELTETVAKMFDVPVSKLPWRSPLKFDTPA